MGQRPAVARLLLSTFHFLGRRFGVVERQTETHHHLSAVIPRIWEVVRLASYPVELGYSDPINPPDVSGDSWERYAVLRIGCIGSILNDPQIQPVPEVVEILAGAYRPDFLNPAPASPTSWDIRPDSFSCISRHRIDQPFILVAYVALAAISAATLQAQPDNAPADFGPLMIGAFPPPPML